MESPMNNHEPPGVVGVLQRWGFHPNGNCYCGCRDQPGPVAGYFLPGHDPRFTRSLLSNPLLHGNQRITEVIQMISGAIPENLVPARHQVPVTLPDTLSLIWGFQPNGLCYCGCRHATGGHFVPDHNYRFGVNLLNHLHGNQQVREAIQRLSGDQVMTTTAGDEARSDMQEAADIHREAAASQRESEMAQRQSEEAQQKSEAAQRQSNFHHREAQSAQSINERSLRAGQGAISTLIAAAETVQAVFADAADTYGRAAYASGQAAEYSAAAAEASREAAAACGRAADACGRSADAMERAADALERAANRLAPSA